MRGDWRFRMRIRVLTLRYSDGLQGFPEDALREACAGGELLEAREHFFVHGNVPHLALVLMLSETEPGRGPRPNSGDDPGNELPEAVRPLYRQLRDWRNARARKDGIPSYVILRNTQLAEICRRLPRSKAALREIEGVGEGTCEKYGAEILALMPADSPPQPSEAPGG